MNPSQRVEKKRKKKLELIAHLGVVLVDRGEASDGLILANVEGRSECKIINVFILYYSGFFLPRNLPVKESVDSDISQDILTVSNV
jgi:hypothetical protein